MLPKGVSDHNPLRICFGNKLPFKESCFRFKKWWSELDEFADLVRKTLWRCGNIR
jgi:hypothetical protein